MENEFSINPLMALCGLPLIPVAIWFFRKRNSVKTFVIGLFIFLLFSFGTLEILGFSRSITRVISEALLILLLFFSLTNRPNYSLELPGFLLLLGFLLASLISSAISEINLFLLLLFFRDYVLVFLVFYAILNMRMNNKEIILIFKLLLFCSIGQIFSNLIKYIIAGSIIEPYVGSMAVLGGSLTIIFALIGCSFSISLYLHTKNKKFLLLLLGFILFSIIGGKRATVVYLPLLYIALLIHHQISNGVKLLTLLRQILLLILLFSTIIYFSIRLMPSFNQERQVWGSFDLDYALDYSEKYLSTGAGAIEEVGRSAAPVYLFTKVASDSTTHLLFGYGAGHLIKSGFNPLISKTGTQTDATMELYGVGYGARTAFLQLFLQVGIIGLFLYVAIWIKLFIGAKKYLTRYRKLNNNKTMEEILLGFFIVFILDFFSYSVVVTQINPVTFIIFLTLLLCKKNDLLSRELRI